ncbi:MAG: hypothetical protein LBO64_08690 [Desulfovibrio sp.]|jgi:hypothetical protein|nr:hypothetical protein [Desulfovibrio sp.]
MNRPDAVAPELFVPEEYLPLHRCSLDYLRKRIADVSAGMALVAESVADSDAPGAAQILEMLAERLDFIGNEEMTPESLVAPVTRERIEIRSREAAHVQ